jgi:hypothetical protein
LAKRRITLNRTHSAAFASKIVMSMVELPQIMIRPKLDFGQFSGPGNGHFAGISDASANFRTVLGAPRTYQISLCTPYSRAFRAFARSKIGQSQAKIKELPRQGFVRFVAGLRRFLVSEATN